MQDVEIKQAYFSSAIKHFASDFYKLWDVQPYSDKTAPAIFFGCYNDNDVEAINNHKTFKVLAHTGRMLPRILKIKNENIVLKLSPVILNEHKTNPNDWTRYYCENGFRTKYAMFPIKDFSMFRPNKLGRCIYFYAGSKARKQLLGWKLAKYIEQSTRFKVIFGMLGNSIDYVKENYYDHCFVNFKPSTTAGMTTAIELAYMGRLTISNSPGMFCRHYGNITEVLQIIEQESKKIGTIQPSMIGKYYDTGAEWKQVDFWT